MTPYKQRRSTHLYSDNTGISTFGGETTASTTELFPTKWSEEEKRNSSILDAEIVSSSPLRSKNNGQMDLLFGLDLDVYEEESLTPHHNKNSSKNSRRLFRVDSASAGHARSQAQTHLFRRDNSLFPTTQERGNQKNTGTGTGTRSSTSTNTSTNESLVSSSLELSHTSSPSTSLSLSPASSLCSNSKYNPSLPLPLPPVTAAATVAGGRKRSSVERRLGSSAFGPSSLTPARTTATTTPMIQSPHCLSPNSFLTMDGRFVQSKNPFSSPMVTDSNNTLTPNSTPAPSSLHHQQYYGTCTGTAGRHFQYPSAAPSFPLLLQSNGMNSSHTNGNKSQQHPSSMECQSGANPSSIISNTSRRSFLPPRSQFHPSWSSHHNNDTPVTEATAGLRAVSIAAPQQQRPTTKASPPSPSTKMISTPRYFCVGPCSPIPEDQSPTLHHHSQHPTTYLSSSPENTMMECTDVASAGSLHKVRRIHRSDDVVSATGYHLTHSYQGSSSIDQQRPIVDSNLNLDPMEDDDEEDRKFDRVSPTDVTQFFPTLPSMKNAPNPPPTPIKQRPSHQPYSNNNTNNSCDYSSFYQRPRLLPRTPGPPLLERKNNAALRTPHPWSTIHSGHDDEFEEQDEQGRMDSVAHHFANSNSRFHTDFDVIGELGRGSFGNVFKVLSRLDGCMYAVKKAHRQAKGEADRDRMLKEVYALAALSDQTDMANFHIVRFHQAWIEDDRLYIQTELCSGTLRDEMERDIHNDGLATIPRRYKLLREILLALDLIHRHNMVHLDIKPENIFLKNDQYKLGDFGLVTKLSGSQDVEEGDSRYMSLELLSGDHRDDLTKSDIYSLGATMYEICLRRSLPMNGPEWQDIRAGKLCVFPSDVDVDMTNIIHRMMDSTPGNRPSPISLLKHPQLLSDEQKALNVEKTKVIQANIQLAAQKHRMGLPPKRKLTRANTWSGSSLPHI